MGIGTCLIISETPDETIKAMDESGEFPKAWTWVLPLRDFGPGDARKVAGEMRPRYLHGILVASDCGGEFTCDKCGVEACAGCGMQIVHNADTDVTWCVECLGQSIWMIIDDRGVTLPDELLARGTEH